MEGYNYNGFNYYSLRDLAVILNFDVSYDNGFLEIYNYGVMYEGYTELRNTPDEIESAYINKFCEYNLILLFLYCYFLFVLIKYL